MHRRDMSGPNGSKHSGEASSDRGTFLALWGERSG